MRNKNSKGLTLTIRMDPQSGGIYFGLRENLPFGRTEVVQSWPLVAVDWSKNGEVMGIEAVGHSCVTIENILKTANIHLPAKTIAQAELMPEMVPA
jgi:uncharacterized protein YuzE